MSRVQFNLLPDSKLALNRAQHTKRLVYTISILASVISVGILLIMLVLVDVVQKKIMNDAAGRVYTASSQLQNLKIDNIITVQSQLQALTGLHQSKHISSRIFTYLPKITPPNVSINKLDLDLSLNTMTISGTADSQKAVNTFVDTLKFTTYKINSTDTPTPAFQSVVETGFNINAGSVGYTISMNVDPNLFANNLKDAKGNPSSPQISVNSAAASAALKDPSSTLFNSSQSAGGQ